MQLAIVVVAYKSERWLKKCLGSCVSYAPQVPVYVVDNASPDGSSALVAREFSTVHLLKQDQNRGFAGGNNVGMAAAIEAGAEAVFLLNPDAELRPGVLPALASYLENNPRVAAVQPAILLPSGKVNSMGNSYVYLGFGEAGGNGLTLAEAKVKVPWLAQPAEPPSISGAASLWRTTALRQVGYFAEELFMYHEDLELSLRCRLAGWRLAVVSEVSVVHSYEPSRSLLQFYYMERNRYLVWLWYFKLPTLLLLLLPWLMSEVALLVTAALGGWFGERVKALGYLCRPATWRNIVQQRKHLKQLRACSDAYLLSFASAVVEYHDGDTGMLTRYVFNPVSWLLWGIIKPLIHW